ncbi:MAG: hypothetical protein MJA29_08120 [Candidatus Omnitrophica bacterium]|nr:hypothetical protein [Candidatus Omnitrophota bacterium]
MYCYFPDIVFADEGQQRQAKEKNTEDDTAHFKQVTHESSDPMMAEFEKILDISEELYQNDDALEAQQKGAVGKKKMCPAATRVKWNQDEEDEIRRLFKRHFLKQERPKPKMCQKAIDESKKAGGVIWKRSKSTLKKKVFRMIDALKQESE